MGDYAIKAQLSARCPQDEVRRWLDSPAGIAGWWSDRVEGAAASVGDRFRVSFPTTPVVFELVVEETSDQLIDWHVPESPPWWKGTHIVFELSSGDGETTLLFTHRGFDPEDPIIQVITPAWVRFLDNLVAVAESGKPRPAVVN
ncbi:MAG TPA: SRPBCC domain-containing protein [Acidimicrobiia bacterium]|nr:SRPBCC domain-containing protein [Acidimicrobiia bacterium]